MHCVYITFYFGSLLPPFYIGSSSEERVHSGYHGSVASSLYAATWKAELKNNPGLFETRIVSLHPTRQKALAGERSLHQKLSVVASPLHINQVVAGEKFDFTGHKHTAQTIQKLKNRVVSPETRLKISIAAMGRIRSASAIEKTARANTGQKRSVETKNKMSVSGRGRIMPKQSAEANEKRRVASTGLRHSDETKQKISAHFRGRKLSPESLSKLRATRKANAEKRALQVPIAN